MKVFKAVLKTMTTIGIVIEEKAKVYSEKRNQCRLERSARQILGLQKKLGQNIEAFK